MKKKYFYLNFIFSYNIAQVLHNAVLVIKIDHWVIENGPSQVGRISENPGISQIGGLDLRAKSMNPVQPFAVYRAEKTNEKKKCVPLVACFRGELDIDTTCTASSRGVVCANSNVFEKSYFFYIFYQLFAQKMS